MRTSIIMAVAALGLFGGQASSLSNTGNLLVTAAHADALQRYEGATTLQHATAPRPAAPPIEAAAEQTGVDNGAFRQAAAEQTGVDNGRLT